MNKEQLNDILEKHKKWLEVEEDGARADLSYANLRGVNLSYADLKGADLSGVNLRGANLSGANLRSADLNYANLSDINLRWANLSGADMKGANLSDANLKSADLRLADLSGADMRGADIDFSCLPLWCGSLGANFDDRQLIQIAYHLVKAGVNSNNASAETKKELSKLIDFANKFHRAEECGRI